MEPHKHVAHQQGNGSFTISRDGYTINCPKTIMLMPVVSQLTGQVEGMQPQQIPCSTMCPFASIKEGPLFEPAESGGSTATEKIKHTYVIECEGARKEVELDEIKLNNSGKNGLVKTM